MKTAKNFSVIAVTAVAIGALAIAGAFAVIAGAMILPALMLLRRKKLSNQESQENIIKPSNVIEADFQRVDRPEDRIK